MAVFVGPEDFQRLDYRLLQNGSINLYHDPAFLAEDAQWLKDHNYKINTFDCSAWENKETVFESIAIELGFPDYFGRNLDALNDCLGDIEIPEESGRVLIFRRYDYFTAKMPETAQIILDIIQDQSRYFLLWGRRLMALVQSNDPKMKFEPVGACAVDWNPKEWLNKSRGL